MLNKILVAIDKSVASQYAFNTALEMAQAFGAELIVVYVLDVFDPASPKRPAYRPIDGYSFELDSVLRKNYERQWVEFVDYYNALLWQKQTEAEAVGVTASHLQSYGRPGPAICKTAKDSHVDLVILGSHGRSGLRELILGSVSNYVMHHAPCSVLVVHEQSTTEPIAETDDLATVAS
ncbi:MAG: universal stress protein [Cyanobacteria bacterium P01_D01_bin.44]